jgi:hypothetical protein
MKNLKSFLRRGEVLEVLKMGNYGSSSFRKAIEKAYMSDSFTKYIVGNSIIFEQGSGRLVKVPADIVEDVIGTELQVSRRVA